MKLFRVGIVTVLLPLQVACGLEDDGAPSDRASEVIRLAPATVIGRIEGDPDYLFGDVTALAVDAQDRVVVGDRIGATVRAYDPDGGFLGEIAHEGEGPGEIQGWPAHLEFGPDGRLYVRDALQVIVFAPRAPGGLADSLVATWRASGYGNLTGDRSRVTDDGAYFYPEGAIRPGEPRIFYYVMRGGEMTADTLDVPPYAGLGATLTAFYAVGQGSGRMVDGLNRVPFAPEASWHVTRRGTLLSTDGETPQLLETNLDGDTVRVIPLAHARRSPVSDAERADSLAALEARIDSLPVPLDDVMNLGEGVAERRLPAALPLVLRVHLAEDESIWLERWPPAGGRTRLFDALDGDGRYLRSVELQAAWAREPIPYFGERSAVGAIVDAETGVQRVVRFELPDGN
ncbi:MAG: hypothetical protein R3195_18535 [Gemmatimonadota bacterium]|nr:hypothetical protein [Gemmatimonadota bacterium]